MPALALLLSVPSLLYLGIGNFPSTHELGDWFSTDPGLTLLFATAAASLIFTVLALILLARAWRPTRARPLAEPTAALVFRLAAATGGLVAGAWLMWIRLNGTPLDEQILDTDSASLINALNDLLFGLGLALFTIGLFALFPPAGAAAMATTSGIVVSGGVVISAEAAVGIIGGTAAIAYAEATADSSGDSGPSSSTSGNRGGSIDESQKRFNPEEREIAEILQSEGKNVQALKESTTPGVKTPDALVDGVATEFKTVRVDNPNAINNNLNKAKHQAQDVIINARNSGLSESDARQGLNRFLRFNLIGDGYNITWP